MVLTIIAEKKKKLKNGDHPIMLRIAHKKDRALVFLGISCPEELWDFENNAPKKHHPDKELIKGVTTEIINTYHTVLLDLIKQKQIITPRVLIEAVKTAAGKEEARKIFPFFDLIIDRLLQAGKVGSSRVYKDAKLSLKRFASSTNLLFTDINQTFLNNYEVFLRKANLAETSMSVYFRTLRALFNKAIQEKLININTDPFKEFKISKFNTATKKRAITHEEIQRIAELEIDSASSLSEIRDYFLFSFFALGMSFIDIAQLRWKDIVQNHITYRRAKTGKIIHFELLPPAKAIIEQYSPITGTHPENYIFPILNRLKHVTPLQIDNRITKVLHIVNSGLKEIAKLAQISGNLTFYVARHTFATVMKYKGVSIYIIRKAMAHTSTETTEIYLNEFEDKVIDEAIKCLLW